MTAGGAGGAQAGGAAVPTEVAAWGVLLERVSGVGHAERARQRAAQLGPVFPGETVRARDSGDYSVVLLGVFDGPRDRGAQEALESAKSLTVNGRRPFARAFLVPPGVSERGSVPQFSLVDAVRAAGRDVKYTLQIERFTDGNAARRAAAAERRTVELRRAGEEAYYQHGPRLSVVTIGLFTDEDYDPAVDRPSPQLLAIQARFPYALKDGERFRLPGETRDQSTFLVNVPRN